MKLSKISLRKALLGVLLFSSATPLIAQSTPTPPANTNSAPQPISAQDVRRFAEAIAQIKQFYIEPIENKTLFNNAIRGMLNNLDPHSTYLDTNDLRDLQTMTTGEFAGIGVEVMPENGFIKVVSPLDDTPAFKAGLKPGDLIIRIDNKLVKDMTMEQAINMIRGKKGTEVGLTIVRKDQPKPLTIKVTREAVKVPTVKSRLLENGYGYVRITFFQAAARPELDKAITQLKQQSGGQLKGLILDLRNNPGGLLDAAVAVSDEFLDPKDMGKNKLIVYTKGRIPGQDMQASAADGDAIRGVPLVVLINGGSASASEIVAGALQDHKRALVVGTKSFGKGSVQTVIPIDAQSAIKLTTALYYTPSGRIIQAKGIQPDVIIADLKLAKSDTQDIVIAPVQEADLQRHLEVGKESDQAKQQTKADNQSETKEKSLAQEDFQLYQALNLLKALYAAKM